MENIDYGLLGEMVLQKTHPVYAINEETREIVFTNKKLDEMMGCSLVGEDCMEAFFGDQRMTAVIPASREPGESYAWDYADKSAGKLFKILDLWFESRGTRYRVGVITDTSDLLDLNRSITDYLWLMQELSKLQIKMAQQKENVMPTLLEFFCSHYKASRATISFFEDGCPVTYSSDGESVTELDQIYKSKQPPYTFEINGQEFSLWLEDRLNEQAWEDDRDFIMSVAGLYIENSMLWRRLKWENTHDDMTGLFNRSTMDSRVKERYEGEDKLGLIYLDMDDLKNTNDYFGREMGDNLIKRLAEILKTVSGEQTTAFRLGGDEFVLVCEDSTQARLDTLIETINAMVAEANAAETPPPLCVTCGRAMGKLPFTFEGLLRTAEKRARSAKKKKQVQ